MLHNLNFATIKAFVKFLSDNKINDKLKSKKQEDYMKKLLIVAAIFALISNSFCYADKNWYDVELAKIRNVKEAKCDIINKQ